MKVLHVIPSVASTRGGPSQAVLEMVKALRQQGVDAEIATTNDNGADLLDVPLHQCSEYQGVPVWFFPRFSPRIHAIREFAFSGSLTRWLWQSMSHYHLLHVHAIFSYPSTAAMAIARHQNIPYIVRPLGQLCQWSLQQSAQRKQRYLQLIERANLNSSRAIHLTSELEQQEVAQLSLQAPVFVLPHGLKTPQRIPDARRRLRHQLELPDDEPIVLFLSRLHPKKGLESLIPALGQLKDQPFTFILAGSGEPDYEQHIRQLVVEQGLEAQTHFYGFAAGEQKALLLQGADLLALTSHSENFGIVVLEAIAAGLPIVVTPGVALASVVSQHQLGQIVDLEVGAIALGIQSQLSQSSSTIQQCRERELQVFRRDYSWKSIARQLSATYADLQYNATA